MTTTNATNNPTVPAQDDKKRRKRGLLIWGSVVAIGALITAATFVDQEWANITPSEGYTTGSHNLQLSRTSRSAGFNNHEASAIALEVPLQGADAHLIPNVSEVTGKYWVKNASDGYESNLTLTMVDKDGGAYTDEQLRDALKFTITIADDQDTQTLTAASYDDLKDGVALDRIVLAPEEVAELNLSAKIVGEPTSDEALEGAAAHLQLRLDGESIPAVT